MTDQRKKSIHVPLAQDVHATLMEHATRLGTPATTLARTAIEAWVETAKRQQLDDEIRDYAVALAGTPVDLDTGLEAAGLDSWVLEE